MLSKTLSALALAAGIGLAGLAAAPAQAEPYRFEHGEWHGPVQRVPEEYEHEWHHHHWYPPHYWHHHYDRDYR